MVLPVFVYTPKSEDPRSMTARTAQSRQKHGSSSVPIAGNGEEPRRRPCSDRQTTEISRSPHCWRWTSRVSNNARGRWCCRTGGNIMKVGLGRASGSAGSVVNIASLFLVSVFLAGSAGDCGAGAGHWPNLESRVVLAPIVFLGRARGRGAVDSDGLYGVTFQITAVLKGAMPPPLRAQVRLTYKKPDDEANGTTTRRPGEQNKRRRHWRTLGCHVVASVRPGRDYYVFAQLDNLNLTAFAPPANANKRTQKIISHSVCEKCARKPLVKGLKDVALVAKEKLRLRCKSRGNPPPQISWFKDGSPITESGKHKRIRIRVKKKRSNLTIRRVSIEDGGLYECRASNVLGEAFATARVRVRPRPSQPTPVTSSTAAVTPSSSPSPTSTPSSIQSPASTDVIPGSTAFPWPGQPCPISSFCLNGGSCIYYQWLGELVCQCKEGFVGHRCESKDVTHPLNVETRGYESRCWRAGSSYQCLEPLGRKRRRKGITAPGRQTANLSNHRRRHGHKWHFRN